MIVVETFLRELFSQIPPVSYTDVNKGTSTIPVKYEWGSQDDLNLYMVQETGNKTPLIWLVQDKGRQISTEQRRRVRLMIAKNSPYKGSRNPKVWDTEFVEFLNPLFENVLKCLERSGATNIENREYEIYREANYAYDGLTTEQRKEKSKSGTIDHWNVIIFEANIIFSDIPLECINQINFNF